ALAGGLALVVGVCVFALARSGATTAAAAQTCEPPERELAGVWDDAARAQIRESFAATQRPYADDAYRRIERALDAHTHEWMQRHREVCEATVVRHEQPVEVMAEQMLCLQRRLRRIAGLVTTLAQADGASLARAGGIGSSSRSWSTAGTNVTSSPGPTAT